MDSAKNCSVVAERAKCGCRLYNVSLRKSAKNVLAERRRNKEQEEQLSKSIISLLSGQSLTVRELCREIKSDPERVAAAVDKMKEEGKISTSISGKLIINE